MLIVTMRIPSPNTSLFPEIDVASKILTDGTYDADWLTPAQSVNQLFSPLSNAESLEIRRRLAFQRFFVRNSNDYAGNTRTVLTLQDSRNEKDEWSATYQKKWGKNGQAFQGGYI
jgi:hypothetical protein